LERWDDALENPPQSSFRLGKGKIQCETDEDRAGHAPLPFQGVG